MNLINKLKGKEIYITLLLYLVVRIINLTGLPIFNDEAIYLDWAWRETMAGGNLYYSLYDSKQPLLMWIFGISEKIFSDPLFAGRFVSVIFGLFTLIGIYKIATLLFDKKIALVSSILYIFVPIFTFYDRQALMEASIGTIGIWSCYFLLRLLETQKRKYGYFLGAVLGIGFFIKSSALIFLATDFFILLGASIQTKNKKILSSFFATLITFFAVDLLLFLNPSFWQSLSKNENYFFSPFELLHFPILTWGSNLIANLEIFFVFVTPIVALTSIFGIYKMIKAKKFLPIILVSWFLVSLFIQTVGVKSTIQRYLVSFLPLTTVFASFFIFSFLKKRNQITAGLLALFIIPTGLSLLLIAKPADYILTLFKFSKYSEVSYLSGYTSGYGVADVINYLGKISTNQKIFVGYAVNSGNPESALIVYLENGKYPNITNGYFDSQLFTSPPPPYICFQETNGGKIYFVSRDQQQAGLNDFLEKRATIKDPYGPNSIGIYSTRDNCKGPVFPITPVRQQ